MVFQRSAHGPKKNEGGIAAAPVAHLEKGDPLARYRTRRGWFPYRARDERRAFVGGGVFSRGGRHSLPRPGNSRGFLATIRLEIHCLRCGGRCASGVASPTPAAFFAQGVAAQFGLRLQLVRVVVP